MRVSPIILFVLISLGAYGQSKIISFPEIESYHYDTNYIESFNSKLALRFVVPKRGEQFSIRDAKLGHKHVYKANEHYGIGIGFTYKLLAVDLAINPGFTQKNIDLFGRTQEFNLKGSAYLKRTLFDAYLRYYKGYFLANPADNTPTWQPNMPYPQREDIQTIGWGFNYTIPFNWEKYTPKVLFVLDGKLKKSAGSFMGISSLYFYHLKADSSIVDAALKPEAQINKANIALLGQLFGYSYTFVYKDFYASAGIYPGVTFPMGAVYSEIGKQHPAFTANFKLMVRAGIGYNIEKWYAGAYLILDNNQTALPADLILGNTLSEFRVFLAYRITAPKVVDKVLDKL